MRGSVRTNAVAPVCISPGQCEVDGHGKHPAQSTKHTVSTVAISRDDCIIAVMSEARPHA